MIAAERFEQIVVGFPEARVLVIGDYFLDKYLDIDRRLAETSLETGLEAHQVVGVRASPGAAGNVVANFRSLGVGVFCLSVIGDDGEGYVLRRELSHRGADVSALVAADNRMTPTYTKPMMREPDGAVHELSRLDHKNRGVLSADIEAQVIARLRELAPRVDAVVVADQVQERNVGVVTDGVRAELIALAEALPDVVFCVDSRERVGLYRGMTLKPNDREAVHAVDAVWLDEVPLERARAAGQALSRRAGKPVYLTIGPKGILVCEGEQIAQVPTVRVEGPIDIVGAGDSTLAGIVAARCAGATPVEAALMGNLTASVTIRQLGTTGTATPQQLREALGC